VTPTSAYQLAAAVIAESGGFSVQRGWAYGANCEEISQTYVKVALAAVSGDDETLDFDDAARWLIPEMIGLLLALADTRGMDPDSVLATAMEHRAEANRGTTPQNRDAP